MNKYLFMQIKIAKYLSLFNEITTILYIYIYIYIKFYFSFALYLKVIFYFSFYKYIVWLEISSRKYASKYKKLKKEK